VDLKAKREDSAPLHRHWQAAQKVGYASHQCRQRRLCWRYTV